jgi:hypothetical protein
VYANQPLETDTWSSSEGTFNSTRKNQVKLLIIQGTKNKLTKADQNVLNYNKFLFWCEYTNFPEKVCNTLIVAK